MRRLSLPSGKRKTRVSAKGLGRIAATKKLAIFACITAVAASIPALFYGTNWGEAKRATWNNQILSFTAQAGLNIAEITVEGREHVAIADLLAALSVRRGDPILAIDLHHLQERLHAIAWVQDAAIERRLPDTLHIRLTERRPIALWQNKGTFTVIDREGKIMPGATDSYSDLLLVVGEGAPTHAAALLAALDSEPFLRARVKAAQRVSNRRWNVILDSLENGIEVRLPEDDLEGAWHRLAKLQREKGLLEQLTMIDLRIQDRLYIKPAATPGPQNTAPNGQKMSAAFGKDA